MIFEAKVSDSEKNHRRAMPKLTRVSATLELAFAQTVRHAPCVLRQIKYKVRLDSTIN
jgi:hypothetical protein